MTDSFLYNIPALIISVLLFIGIIIFNILGFQVMKYQKKKNPEHSTGGLGPLEAALLGLLSLMLAFTFNKSASNYDSRKVLLVQEANDIGTALFRTDLYPDSIRQELKTDFKKYIIARIDYYKAGNDENKIQDALKNAETISKRIWLSAAINSRKATLENRSMQMIPAVNNMIDSMTRREASRISRVPESILWLLFLLTITGSFIVGYTGNTKNINWIIICLFSLMTVVTIYLILDLDRPRSGLINTKSLHRNIEKLLDSYEDSTKINK
jgi:uncharacterized membrane protein YsdA (DUF1294 family)